jgi:peroxiredoxin/outer membrane lipoprotein-sorting protein
MISARYSPTILSLLFILTSVWQAQTPPDPNEILREVRNIHARSENYEVEYSRSFDRRDERDGLFYETRQRIAGKVWVAERGRLRIEARDSQREAIKIVDGRLTWLYLPARKVYAKLEADAEGRAPRPTNEDWTYHSTADVASGLIRRYSAVAGPGNKTRPVVNYLREESLEISGRKIPCHVIEVSETSAPLSKYTRVLWIEKNRKVVWREIETSQNQLPEGSTMTSTNIYDFNIIRFNEPIPDQLFVFVPPPEVREVASLSGRAPGAKSNLVGNPAPEFAVKDLDGKSVSLQNLRGKVVLLNFWATWCGPCIVEMPHLEKLYQEFKNKDVAIVTISNEDPQTIREFLLKNKYSFGSLVDDGSAVSQLYQVKGIPQTVFLSKSGKVSDLFVGTRTEEQFRAGLAKARNLVDNDPPLAGPKEPLASAMQSACVPQLIFPGPAAVLPNRNFGNQKAVWEFRWGNCSGAARFHLQIKHTNAEHALYDNNSLLSLSYRYQFGSGFIATNRLKGWTWRVRAQFPGQWGEWSEFRPFEVDEQKFVYAKLPAPQLLSPADQSVFNHFPRETKLVWQEVPGAASYFLEIDYTSFEDSKWRSEMHGVNSWVFEAKTTTHTFNFVGAQPGRWRVWVIDAEGRPGPKSEWWRFTYTR